MDKTLKNLQEQVSRRLEVYDHTQYGYETYEDFLTAFCNEYYSNFDDYETAIDRLTESDDEWEETLFQINLK